MLFGGTYFLKSAHSFFGAWSFVLVHIQSTPSEGPKTFKTKFLRSRTIEIGPLPWSNFMVHIVDRPLNWVPQNEIGKRSN
jgi:hypothetical protein